MHRSFIASYIWYLLMSRCSAIFMIYWTASKSIDMSWGTPEMAQHTPIYCHSKQFECCFLAKSLLPSSNMTYICLPSSKPQARPWTVRNICVSVDLLLQKHVSMDTTFGYGSDHLQVLPCFKVLHPIDVKE